MNPKRKVLLEAADIIDGDRNKQYGEPSSDFNTTAVFWNEYLERVFERQRTEGVEKPKIEPHDVASMMILLKISRQTVSPFKYDHDLDIAGYTGCRQQCVEDHKLIKINKEEPPVQPSRIEEVEDHKEGWRVEYNPVKGECLVSYKRKDLNYEARFYNHYPAMTDELWTREFDLREIPVPARAVIRTYLR